ncbi:hypothetical protein V8G61_08975 [Gaetbulibacter sp. M240]|uniref:hypothetical protein n=1 Tax=Gaetbulibacter sp. M240 TaxID=3126511 RepID=UPI00374FDAE0
MKRGIPFMIYNSVFILVILGFQSVAYCSTHNFEVELDFSSKKYNNFREKLLKPNSNDINYTMDTLNFLKIDSLEYKYDSLSDTLRINSSKENLLDSSTYIDRPEDSGKNEFPIYFRSCLKEFSAITDEMKLVNGNKGYVNNFNFGNFSTGPSCIAKVKGDWKSDIFNIVVLDQEKEVENYFKIGFTGVKKESFTPKETKYGNTYLSQCTNPQEAKFYYGKMDKGSIENEFSKDNPKCHYANLEINQNGRDKKLFGFNEDDKGGEQGIILLEDAMTGNWQENWFLDGKEATLSNSKDGLFFSAGTVTKSDDPIQYHAHHAVLWTKQEFEGDIKICYEMTRVDDSDYGTTLLYIQAQGIGSSPYVKDISAWSKFREIPSMETYFTYMNLLSLSFRENMRCKRYPWKDENLEWYPGKGLIQPMVDYGKILPGKTYLVEVEKRTNSLRLRLFEKESQKLMIDQLWNTGNILMDNDLKRIEKGRIGLRHMSTRQFIYRDFKVERL